MFSTISLYEHLKITDFTIRLYIKQAQSKLKLNNKIYNITSSGVGFWEQRQGIYLIEDSGFHSKGLAKTRQRWVKSAARQHPTF